MKKLLLLLALLNGSMPSFAQRNSNTPQLSAFTRLYLNTAQQTKEKTGLLPGYVYKSIKGKTYISAFIKVLPGFDEASLSSLGVFIGTRAGNIRTVQIPLEQLTAVTKIAGISHIDLDAPVYPLLDAARKSTKADSAQLVTAMPMPLTGKNVLVGIIDAGFDFNHPTLYDTAHASYRVKKVWTQKIDGTPPAGFAYGNDMSDPYIIRASGYDTAITSHGTHVTGIAAGSGYGSAGNNRFRGIAYESDMAFVCIMPPPYQWAAPGASDIIDGISYLFTYAASVFKPCIANLSWGSSIGPHDGHSFFSEACDALTGPGRIFSCSAGNNGDDTIHLEKTFTTASNSVSTFVTFSEFLDSANQKTWLDVWGDTAKSFCINVKLYNGATAIDSTGNICISDTSRSYALIGSDGDTCYVTVSMSATEYNGKPHAFLTFHSLVPDNVCLTVSGTSGTVNMWQGYVFPPTGYYGALRKLGYPWAVSGDTRMTVSDYSSSFSAISVGAYTSKGNFTNISGASLGYSGAVVGRIAPFSSKGPIPGNRVKPDITGPGFALASGVSSFDTSYGPTGDNYSGVISTASIDGRVYPYAMAAGTSMSSPAVSGVIAMMLQLNSTLTPDSVKSIMRLTAIKDINTGTIPAAGSNTWGHGKINAYAAIRHMAGVVSVENTLNPDPLHCLLYPNPSTGNFSISYHSNGSDLLTVEVYDITGRVIQKYAWAVNAGYNTRNISLENVAKGVYFTRLSAGGKVNVIKTMIQ
jgi:minor extracellular serine protease Vpr